MIQVLKQCGDDLSRENIMKQAANIKDLELPMLLPGMKINTSPTNFSPDPPDAARAVQRRELDFVRRLAAGVRERSSPNDIEPEPAWNSYAGSLGKPT